jgi:hypothetical protein
MWHTTCMHVIKDDSWLLMDKIQIHALTPNLSFGHNFCYRYSNGLCKPNLDIYVLEAFQYYKELFNPMSFDPSNYSLKIRESIGTPTPKVGVQLGVCGLFPSHSLTILGVWMMFSGCTFGLHLSCPCFNHKPKARVVRWKVKWWD